MLYSAFGDCCRHEGYGVFGGVTTFITGAGGWLQSVFAGYGGIRLARDGSLLLKNPVPPPNCTAMRLRQLSYRGNLLTVEVMRTEWSVALVDGSANTNVLHGLPVASLEFVTDAGDTQPLQYGKPISCKVGQSGTIRVSPKAKPASMS